MRSPAKLFISVVCLSLVLGAPAALAQPIPRSLIRLCLRNIFTGIACYVVGRGGELIVDGSLSAAWAKAKETVTGATPEDDGKPEPQPLPRKGPEPFPLLKNPIIEPIKPSELNALSKRLPGSASHRLLTEGFLIYDAPKGTPKPIVPKSELPTSKLPKPGQSVLAPTTKPFFSKTTQPKLVPSKNPDPYFSPDAYRARKADKLVAPGKPLGVPSSFAVGQLSLEQLACQQTRERLYGLSLYDMLGAPDFNEKFNRRMTLVVAPCAHAHRF